jgi:hypothetical protein
MAIDMSVFDPNYVKQQTLNAIQANADATYEDQVRRFKLAAADYLANCQICYERGLELPKFGVEVPRRLVYASLAVPPAEVTDPDLKVPVFVPAPTSKGTGGILFQTGVPSKEDQILLVLQEMAKSLNAIEARVK